MAEWAHGRGYSVHDMEEGGRPHECTAVQIVINQYGDGDTAGGGIGGGSEGGGGISAVACANFGANEEDGRSRSRSRRCRWPWGRAFIVRTSLLIQTHTHLRIVCVCVPENVCSRLGIHKYMFGSAQHVHRTDAPSTSASVSVCMLYVSKRAHARARTLDALVHASHLDRQIEHTMCSGRPFSFRLTCCAILLPEPPSNHPKTHRPSQCLSTATKLLRRARTRVSICVCVRSFVGVMWLTLVMVVVVVALVLIRQLASAVDLCAIVSGTH